MSDLIATPVIKWVGGKRQLLPLLLSLLPEQWSGYHEPFVGGGALFFELWSRSQPGQGIGGACLNDFNQRLIHTYQGLAADWFAVVRELEQLAQDCTSVGYAAAVKEFNKHRPMDAATNLFVPQQLPLHRQAALMIYISRLCFNGLFRENRFGAFNVGYCKNPQQFNMRADELKVSALALRSANLTHGDFERAMLRAQPGDLIFLDPPYDATFAEYVKGSFGPHDQKRLAQICHMLDLRGVKWMMTNSATPRVRDLWRGFHFTESEETRAVNSDGEDRGPVGCVVVRNYLTADEIAGWKSIKTAPMNATTVQVRLKDGTVYPDAHWACDLSGENQPPFKGWFIPCRDSSGKVTSYSEISEPVMWREIPA